MNKKIILAGIAVCILFIAGVFYMGQITAPEKTTKEEPISMRYTGNIQGTCIQCNFPEGVTGNEYYGTIVNSRIEGWIYYNGEKTDCNITVEQGIFNGELSGSYRNAEFMGGINGYLNATITGTLYRIEARRIPLFFEIPQWILIVIILMIILAFLHYSGLLKRLMERRPEPPITKDDAILARELRDWLWENNSVKLRKILTNLPMPLHKPIHIKFVCELEGENENSKGERIAIMYNSSRKFFGLRRDQSENELRMFLRERIVRKPIMGRPEIAEEKPQD
jgi:hypothetical protein